MLAAVLGFVSSCAFYFCVYGVVSHLLCRFRVGPVILMRAWYAVTLLITIVLINWSSAVVHYVFPLLLGWSSKDTSRCVSGLVAPFLWLQAKIGGPQIRFFYDDGVAGLLHEATLGKGGIFFCNHTSFADTFCIHGPGITS